MPDPMYDSMSAPMPAMMCSQFDDASDNWLAGRRSPAFAEHLAACPHCRQVLADWENISATARQIGLSQPEPPPQVWQSLAVQLRKEGIIVPGVSPLQKWGAMLPHVTARPVLSAAYVAVLIVAGVLVSNRVSQVVNPPVVADPQVAQLFQSWSEPDPEIAATLRQNLAMVDNDISLCQQSVREEPQSELARDYLNDAYQQKAQLLETMVERGVSLQ
jgi:hypothetical protein